MVNGDWILSFIVYSEGVDSQCLGFLHTDRMEDYFGRFCAETEWNFSVMVLPAGQKPICCGNSFLSSACSLSCSFEERTQEGTEAEYECYGLGYVDLRESQSGELIEESLNKYSERDESEPNRGVTEVSRPLTPVGPETDHRRRQSNEEQEDTDTN